MPPRARPREDDDQPAYFLKWSTKVTDPGYVELCKVPNLMSTTLMQMSLLERILADDAVGRFNDHVRREFRAACKQVHLIREQLFSGEEGRRKVPDLRRETLEMLVARLPK